MISWPSSLPQMPERNYTTGLLSGLSSFEETLYVSRTRTYPEESAKFSFRQCTILQVQTLRNFYDVTLNQKAPFAAPWLEPVGYLHHFCQFVSPPTVSAMGFKFDISIDVLIISGVPIDADGNITYGG